MLIATEIYCFQKNHTSFCSNDNGVIYLTPIHNLQYKVKFVFFTEPTSFKATRQPFAAINNIKMIVTKKKILPRRKCVSAVFNYKELDADADDTYFCKEFREFRLYC